MLLHVGTYQRAGGPGLAFLTLDRDDRMHIGPAREDMTNASFGTLSSRQILYLVDEREEGAVVAYRANGHGWAEAARAGSGGAAPCYLALAPDESSLAVANYESGTIALLPLDTDGLFHGEPVIRKAAGHGPNRERQDGPHAHCVRFSPDGRWLFHVDLGTDRVLAHSHRAGALGPEEIAFLAPPGSGPRHLREHPDGQKALLICELASTLTLLERDGATLSARQRVSTLPAGHVGDNLGGHLALNRAGDRAYVTNRGHDSIGVFAVDGDGLTPLQHIPSGGASPRHFLLFEDIGRMIVVHEESGDITLFALRPDGTLQPTPSRARLPGAAFLLRIE